ncbi:uncharacterized protein LOC111361069 [Spodoptera litura]|uniref:Uncharacterized protein LOC111361069 n=1 Tax=Spodoptera litura TaxID=69820 RepID=A0A9J7ERK0_SPOLT|nr:uncharacterized protein LOC111361069 [Spodoptera litura]
MDQSKRAAIRKELIKQFLAELGVQVEPEVNADEDLEYLSASPVQREADSTEVRQVSEYIKKIKTLFMEDRTTSEFRSLKRSRLTSSSDDEEEYLQQQTKRRKKQRRRFLTARSTNSTMPVVVTEVNDRPLPSRSNH